ncbi:MAG: transketolase family protein [Suipraeoptans sp.]
MGIEGRALRDAFGDEILELGKKKSNIYVIDGDVGKSCKTLDFAAACPKQHINAGIAEQNACGMAAGIATLGKVPFVSTYAAFGSMRMLEQIRQEICYPNLNVKIACSHGGLTPANDGASHQCIEDMGILRTIPNMTIIMGADYYATRNLIKEASEYDGPVYLRFTRDPIPYIYDENVKLTIGKANVMKTGQDVAIIANGDTVCIAKEAAEILEAKGVSVQLIDMHTIKPIDKEVVMDAAVRIGKIITVEDHNIINGLGSAVCEVVAEKGIGKVARIGVQDQFGQSAPYEKLLELNGITVEKIVEAYSMLSNK